VPMTPVLVASRSASWTSSVGGLGAVLLPKCPLCFAAYGSGLAALGVSPGVQSQLVDLFLAITVTASFVLVLALSVRRRDVFTPVVSGAGVILVLAGRLALGPTALTAVGAVLLVTAAVVNSVRCRVTAR
jgi:hypothetical protein